MDKAKPEEQILYRYEQKCRDDSNIDRTVYVLAACLYQISVQADPKACSKYYRLLPLKLLEKRDVLALLRGDSPIDQSKFSGQTFQGKPFRANGVMVNANATAAISIAKFRCQSTPLLPCSIMAAEIADHRAGD